MCFSFHTLPWSSLWSPGQKGLFLGTAAAVSRCCRLAVVARGRDLATGLQLGSAQCFLKPVTPSGALTPFQPHFWKSRTCFGDGRETPSPVTPWGCTADWGMSGLGASSGSREKPREPCPSHTSGATAPVPRVASRQHLVVSPGLMCGWRSGGSGSKELLPGEEASPRFNHFPKSLHVASPPAALFHCSPAPAATSLR